MVTEIILERKSSQGGTHRPLKKINLLKKAIETRDQIIVCEEGKWKLTQIQSYDYDKFCANEKSDQSTIFGLFATMPPQHDSSSYDPPPQYESPSECSPLREYESPSRSSLPPQDESSLYDARLSMTHHTMSRHHDIIRHHITQIQCHQV